MYEEEIRTYEREDIKPEFLFQDSGDRESCPVAIWVVENLEKKAVYMVLVDKPGMKEFVQGDIGKRIGKRITRYTGLNHKAGLSGNELVRRNGLFNQDYETAVKLLDELLLI